MYGKDSSGIGRPVLVDSGGRLVGLAGKYQDAAINGRLFYASTQVSVTTSTSKNNTFTGIALVNPSTSGKVILSMNFPMRSTTVLLRIRTFRLPQVLNTVGMLLIWLFNVPGMGELLLRLLWTHQQLLWAQA
jgi:hypothetical protein